MQQEPNLFGGSFIASELGRNHGRKYDMRGAPGWEPQHYIVVNGHELVYTTRRMPVKDGPDELEVIVMLPGGKSATVEELRRDGFTVVMPTALRHHPAPTRSSVARDDIK